MANFTIGFISAVIITTMNTVATILYLKWREIKGENK